MASSPMGSYCYTQSRLLRAFTGSIIANSWSETEILASARVQSSPQLHTYRPKTKPFPFRRNTTASVYLSCSAKLLLPLFDSNSLSSLSRLKPRPACFQWGGHVCKVIEYQRRKELLWHCQEPLPNFAKTSSQTACPRFAQSMSCAIPTAANP